MFEEDNFFNEIDNIFSTDNKRKKIKRNSLDYKKIHLSKMPKSIIIYAKLISNTKGEFINSNDYFYNILCDLYSQHKDICNDKKYIKPFNKKTFTFKSSKKILDIKDDNNMIITDIKNALYKKSKFTLRVIPYDANDICGLSIKVSSIVVKKIEK